jgi:phage terminase large subunit GpA-like protein
MSEPFFSEVRPRPMPTEWQVACPSCGEQIAHEMEEDVDGSFSKSDRDGSPIVDCQCGCFFIPANVFIQEQADA